MLWIFILAGAFAETAKEIGAIEATVNVTLAILPPSMIYVGLFLASCFISMAIGTSVGTIVALVPVAAGIATESGIDTGYITAIVAGGAFFGDQSFPSFRIRQLQPQRLRAASCQTSSRSTSESSPRQH